MGSRSLKLDSELGNLPLGRLRKRKSFDVSAGEVADVSVAEALKVGYRHIDCALVSLSFWI